MDDSSLSEIAVGDALPHISVFGNPLVPEDSLPIKILPLLEEEFPRIRFSIDDPTEFMNGEDQEWWILDTVEGIDGVAIFNDIARFEVPKSISVHDYDLSLDIQLMNKLGNLKKVKIIGISPKLSEKNAFKMVVQLLRSNGF